MFLHIRVEDVYIKYNIYIYIYACGSIRNPSLLRSRALWMGGIRSSVSFIGVFDARGYSSAPEKGYMYGGDGEKMCSYIYYNRPTPIEWNGNLSLYYILRIRDVYFSFLAVADLDGLYIVHRIFNNDRWKWPMHDLYIIIMCPYYKPRPRLCIAYTIQYDHVCGHMVTMVGRGIIEINCAHSIRNRAIVVPVYCSIMNRKEKDLCSSIGTWD